MKIRAGLVTALLGLALRPGGLPAAEAEAAPPSKTRTHQQLNQLIREEHGLARQTVPSAQDKREVVADETIQLAPMIVEVRKLPEPPPPETKVEKFFRTGTIGEKVGRTFTKEFWLRPGQGGIGFTLSW